MSDVDFNQVSLGPADWKVLSRVDGKSNLEEIRLLAGLSRDEVTTSVQRLFEAGIISIHREF